MEIRMTTTEIADRKLVLDADEVGALLGCSPWTVRFLHRTGQLPARRVGRLLKWTRADVEAYIGRLEPGKRPRR
jgi:excisionase family DNA binding protein